MGWQDRDYNQDREEMRAYFANPLGLMQFALPLLRARTLQIRLSFWFLLTVVFIFIADFIWNRTPQLVVVQVPLMLAVCLLHEWGHRVTARWVEGNHWEWVIWPLGGMVAPTAPRRPLATFVANVGGIAVNAIIMLVIVGAALAFGGRIGFGANIIAPIGLVADIPGLNPLAQAGLDWVMLQCSVMILMNLFPCYWFDGGHIWQSILWPFTGQWKAGVITVWAGMLLSAPLFIVALLLLSPLMMVFWALVFADCFRRRQALKAVGEGMMEEDDGPSYNYMDTPETRSPKKRRKRWFNAARKRAIRDQAEQAKIDAILDKVKEKGLHSLSWWEKRTLKKATERQRQQDVASRS